MPKNKMSDNIDFYDSYYSNEFDVKGNYHYLDYLFKKLGTISFKNKKVLDVGCGVGVLGQRLNKNYNCKVSGIDLSKVAVKLAIENGILAKVGNIEKKWLFSSNSFDIVISQQVIEHLINPDFFIKESMRVLKPNGILIITTPNLGAWFNRILLLLGFQPFFTEVSTEDKTIGLKFIRNLTNNRKPLGHLRVFTHTGLVELLNFHRFKIKKTLGGKIFYLPKILNPLDTFFSNFPSLSSDLIIIAKKS